MADAVLRSSTSTAEPSGVWRRALRITFSSARLSHRGSPAMDAPADALHRSERPCLRASKSASPMMSFTSLARSTGSLARSMAPCSRRASARISPINASSRCASSSMRSSSEAAAEPADCLASSRATSSLASGERSSCDTSRSSCLWLCTSDSMRSPIPAKARARSPNSSPRASSPEDGRACRSPAPSLAALSLSSRSGRKASRDKSRLSNSTATSASASPSQSCWRRPS